MADYEEWIMETLFSVSWGGAAPTSIITFQAEFMVSF